MRSTGQRRLKRCKSDQETGGGGSRDTRHRTPLQHTEDIRKLCTNMYTDIGKSYVYTQGKKTVDTDDTHTDLRFSLALTKTESA